MVVAGVQIDAIINHDGTMYDYIYIYIYIYIHTYTIQQNISGRNQEVISAQRVVFFVIGGSIFSPWSLAI